jgi:acyl dehydratase
MSTRNLEDISVGETYTSRGRTITKTEIIEFATQFDPQPFHIDEEAARSSIFGGIVASGVHTFGICQRLATEVFYTDTAMLVGRGIDDLRFYKPTYPGDTLSVRVTVTDKEEQSEQSDRGHLDVQVEGFNQEEDRVVSWTALTIIARNDF